jgi:hypothetical protein
MATKATSTQLCPRTNDDDDDDDDDSVTSSVLAEDFHDDDDEDWGDQLSPDIGATSLELPISFLTTLRCYKKKSGPPPFTEEPQIQAATVTRLRQFATLKCRAITNGRPNKCQCLQALSVSLHFLSPAWITL